MVKTSILKNEGQMLNVPDDKIDVKQITHNEAKQIIKQMKQPQSQKQKDHMQKLIELNRIKWESKKIEKKEIQERLLKEQLETHTSVIVKPKRTYMTKKNKAQIQADTKDDDDDDKGPSEDEYQSEDDDEGEEEEDNDLIQKAKAKKWVKEKVEKSQERSQAKKEKLKKANDLFSSINLIDEKINKLKLNSSNSINVYLAAMNKK